MKTKKRSLFLLLALALVLLAGAAGAGYAYWVGNISDPTTSQKEGSVIVGVGEDLSTKFTIDDLFTEYETGTTLVPGQEADVSTDLQWLKDGSASVDGAVIKRKLVADVVFYVNDIKVENDNLTLFNYLFEYSGFFYEEKEIDGDKEMVATEEILLGSSRTYLFKIEFKNEPRNFDEYDWIAGKTIKVEVTFSLTNL